MLVQVGQVGRAGHVGHVARVGGQGLMCPGGGLDRTPTFNAELAELAERAICSGALRLLRARRG
jgi:hypothetical protein